MKNKNLTSTMTTSPVTLKSEGDRWLEATAILKENLLRVDNQARLDSKAAGCYPELLALRTMLLEELDRIQANL